MATNASRTVLITGASSGIGRETSLHLARQGWQVYAGFRKEADGESLTEEAEGCDGALIPVQLDVTNTAHITAVIERIAADVDRLDGVVNNAGIFAEVPLEVLPLDELRKLFEVNVFGAVAVTQAALPLLRAAKGRVVNISSMAGRVSFPIAGGYCASKFALEALTSALRMELVSQEIAVSIINVGAYATEAWRKGADVGSEVLELLDEHQKGLYADMIVEARRINGDFLQQANPMERVVGTIERALTDANPKRRYIAGADARRVELARLLPDGLRERLVMKQLGLG